MEPRKIQLVQERCNSDIFGKECETIIRVAALAVIKNPYAGTFAENLEELFEAGGRIGEILASQASEMLGAPATSYGKAAIVGINGDIEHGGAVIHPKLGKPMRAAVGGGEAVIPSNVKIGGPGTVIDVPLGHKDNSWSFDHFDTMSVMLSDAPGPNEIVMIMAYADGGRPVPRCGRGPVTG